MEAPSIIDYSQVIADLRKRRAAIDRAIAALSVLACYDLPVCEVDISKAPTLVKFVNDVKANDGK